MWHRMRELLRRRPGIDQEHQGAEVGPEAGLAARYVNVWFRRCNAG
jgi:hypothetical protein